MRSSRFRRMAVGAVLATPVYAATSAKEIFAQQPTLAVPPASLAVPTVSPAGVRFLQLEPLHGHRRSPVVTAVAVHEATDTLVAAGDDHAIRWINPQSGSTIATFFGHSDWVRRLQFVPAAEGTAVLLSCGDDGQLIRWSWPTGEPTAVAEQRQLIECDHTLTAMSFDSASGTVAVGGFSNHIHLVALAAPENPRVLHCDCGDQRALAFADGGRTLLSGGRNGEVHVFDIASGATVADHKVHRGRLRSLSVDDAAGRVTTVGEDHRMCDLDWRSGKILSQTELRSGKLLAVETLDADRLVAAGADNTVQIIDRRSGQLLKQLVGHDGTVASIARLRDSLVTAGFDTTIRIWDMQQLDASNAAATVVHPVRSQFFDSGISETTY